VKADPKPPEGEANEPNLGDAGTGVERPPNLKGWVVAKEGANVKGVEEGGGSLADEVIDCGGVSNLMGLSGVQV